MVRTAPLIRPTPPFPLGEASTLDLTTNNINRLSSHKGYLLGLYLRNCEAQITEIAQVTLDLIRCGESNMNFP
jgi:hypothetical protein